MLDQCNYMQLHYRNLDPVPFSMITAPAIAMIIGTIHYGALFFHFFDVAPDDGDHGAGPGHRGLPRAAKEKQYLSRIYLLIEETPGLPSVIYSNHQAPGVAINQTSII